MKYRGKLARMRWLFGFYIWFTWYLEIWIRYATQNSSKYHILHQFGHKYSLIKFYTSTSAPSTLEHKHREENEITQNINVEGGVVLQIVECDKKMGASNVNVEVRIVLLREACEEMLVHIISMQMLNWFNMVHIRKVDCAHDLESSCAVQRRKEVHRLCYRNSRNLQEMHRNSRTLEALKMYTQ